MTNREFYKKEIEKIMYEEGDNVAIKNGKLMPCHEIDCCTCYFDDMYSGECRKNRIKWFKQEHIEPSVDWSKVPVDTKILVNAVEGDSGWIPRHFAKYENGKVYAFTYGATSWSREQNTNINNHMVDWNYAKLADDEQPEYHLDSTQSSETNENTVDGKISMKRKMLIREDLMKQKR